MFPFPYSYTTINWRWPERNQSGNAINFLVQVFGLNFHATMIELTGS